MKKRTDRRINILRRGNRRRLIVSMHRKQRNTVQLTPREHEVLHLVWEGNNNRDIGQKLCISPRTVEVHRAQLLNKLQANNTAQLLRAALEQRLIIM